VNLELALERLLEMLLIIDLELILERLFVYITFLDNFYFRD
jgi:hypothetical protein